MPKLRVMTILGTRPEIIRLSAVIRCCDEYFDHVLVHTGQNWDYTLNEVFFRDLGLRQPDFFLNSVGNNLGETMGNIIAKSYTVMQKMLPDALLVLGDTNSALSALSAKRLKIPVFHMEAGNRCFDENVPEEINRRLVDHIADINMPYTEHGRRYLLTEGIRGETIFVTGSPMYEVLRCHLPAIAASDVLRRLSLQEGQYIVVSAHREENIDNENNFYSLMSAVNVVAEIFGMPVIYSTHPRSRKVIEERGYEFHPNVHSIEPFGFLDYNRLQQSAFCVLSDSGTLCEESAILDFPAVLLRTSTERPEALDAGRVIIGGIEASGVMQAIHLVRAARDNDAYTAPVPSYQHENVSLKVVKIIQSYVSIVNKNVWAR